MKIVRRFLLLVLLLAAFSVLAGCNSGKTGNTESQESATITEEAAGNDAVKDPEEVEELTVIDEFEVVTEENQNVGGF